MCRFVVLGNCVAAVLLFSSFAHAQAAKTLEQEVAELKRRIATIEATYVGEGELAKVSEVISGVQKVNDEQTALLKQMADSLAGAQDNYVTKDEFNSAVSTLADINQQQSNQLESLRKDFDTSVNELNNVVNRLAEISENRPGVGHVPVLSRQARETPFATTVITNEMSYNVWASVNGMFRELRAGEVWPVQVRPGTVTTTLPGFEGSRNWVIGAENGYLLSIRITPR